jgi:phosphonate transport system substrate-binding protein
MRRIALAAALALAALAAFAAPKPFVVVWYPNNSGEDWKAGRQALDDIISKAIGRPVVDALTTDYVIAIQAIASGQAAMCYPGAVGYIQAEQKNPKVVPLVTVSSAKGTLDDSVYYSRIAVRQADAAQYLKGGKYVLDPLKGKTFSFVSSSSTSGFLFPASILKSYFAKSMGYKADDKVEDLFLEGGEGKLFGQVVFGQSHQGSIYNVLTGKADACAVDDIDVDSYFDLLSGKASAPGAVYAVKKDAAAPFDTIPAGTSFVILASSAVRQAPLIVNAEQVSKEEMAKLRAALASDSTADNPLVFTPKDYKDSEGKPVKGLWKKTGKERFLPVEAGWYADIREMMR